MRSRAGTIGRGARAGESWFPGMLCYVPHPILLRSGLRGRSSCSTRGRIGV